MTHRRERRWIILAQDGQHTTLGRDSDPTMDEIDLCGSQLRSLGLGGWLAVLDGRYYEPLDTAVLMMVREVAPVTATGTWEQAEAAFQRVRDDVVSPRATPQADALSGGGSY